MWSRRSFLASLAGVAVAFPAKAFEFQPYDPAVVEKAIGAGEPVVVHVYATWCVTCKAQRGILDSQKSDPAYDRIAFFRVDYDRQKDVVAKLDCPRSTLIAYRDGKEVARMSWETSRAAVTNVLKAAM